MEKLERQLIPLIALVQNKNTQHKNKVCARKHSHMTAALCYNKALSSNCCLSADTRSSASAQALKDISAALKLRGAHKQREHRQSQQNWSRHDDTEKNGCDTPQIWERLSAYGHSFLPTAPHTIAESEDAETDRHLSGSKQQAEQQSSSTHRRASANGSAQSSNYSSKSKQRAHMEQKLILFKVKSVKTYKNLLGCFKGAAFQNKMQ